MFIFSAVILATGVWQEQFNMTGWLRVVLMKERTVMTTFSRDTMKWLMMSLQNDSRKMRDTGELFTKSDAYQGEQCNVQHITLLESSSCRRSHCKSGNNYIKITRLYIISRMQLFPVSYHSVFLVVTVFWSSPCLEKLEIIQNLNGKIFKRHGVCCREATTTFWDSCAIYFLYIDTFGYEIAACYGEI